MSLRTPILDDRSYAQLRDELIARIPVYAPEWTDHHPSDPGITLIELFAFLGENLLYRFNQIPDATKMAFLDLLDIELRPAQPSTGMVQFQPVAANFVDVPLSSRLLAGEIPFRSLDEVRAWPLTALAAIRRSTEGEEFDVDTTEFVNRTAEAMGVSTATASPYRTVFGAASPLTPGGDVLDPAESIDRALYLALTSPDPLPAELAGGTLTFGVVPNSVVPSMQQRAVNNHHDQDTVGATPPMQWQVCTTTPIANPDDPATADPVWLDLDVIGDTSAGMTRPGVVSVRLPTDSSTVGIYLPDNPEARGAGDQPPLIEDPTVDIELRAWLRVFHPTGGDLPALEWIGLNAARVEQASLSSAELLGTGTGNSNQVLSLVHRNVLGDVSLDVEEIGQSRWIPWEQVDDFSASDVDDRHFTVDREAGTIACGDGRRGRVWQIGERVRCRNYRHGGGADGNVGPKAINKVRDVSGVAVANPLPTRGGADAEPLAEAVARIPSEFGRRDRAVTVSDFRELAEATPGAGIARAETLRLFDPRNPQVDEAAGVVSVVVWPDHDRTNPNAPRPDKPTLDAVCAHLDARRLITTELYVIPPTYRPISISVGLQVKDGHGIESVRRWVELVLRQYLAPLPPYGPEGRGWPLGRPVFGPELEATALQVEGVEFLSPSTPAGTSCPVGLRLAELIDGVWVEPADRTVHLEKWEVPELAEITVVAGEALQPGVAAEPPPPPGLAIPVRSPREVC